MVNRANSFGASISPETVRQPGQNKPKHVLYPAKDILKSDQSFGITFLPITAWILSREAAGPRFSEAQLASDLSLIFHYYLYALARDWHNNYDRKEVEKERNDLPFFPFAPPPPPPLSNRPLPNSHAERST